MSLPVRRGFVLEIIGANTSHYHGARAYFDGDYCKIGELDAKQKAEVTKSAETGAVDEKCAYNASPLLLNS